MSTEDLSDVVLRVREKLLQREKFNYLLVSNNDNGTNVSAWDSEDAAIAHLLEILDEYDLHGTSNLCESYRQQISNGLRKDFDYGDDHYWVVVAPVHSR